MNLHNYDNGIIRPAKGSFADWQQYTLSVLNTPYSEARNDTNYCANNALFTVCTKNSHLTHGH